MTHWTISLGSDDETDGIFVGSYEGIQSAVAGILMGCGINWVVAKTYGSKVVKAAREQQDERRWNHRVPPLRYRHSLSDGRMITVRSDDLPEDPTQFCRGMTNDGGRCPKHLNHLGEC